MAEHIIVGMSGGVDSSVAAMQLLEQRYNVTGLFMKNWEEDDDNDQCTATADLADAQQVCDRLGIPLKTVNFSTEYWDDVFETFLNEYRSGRTPNPDILCNQHIKFKAFLDFALELGADRIATGHYARVSPKGVSFCLLKGHDQNKDQSYFLYTLGQKTLVQCLFPLGDMIKPEVRTMAERAGFANSRKKDSTGICFIGERKFAAFLNRFLPARPGEIRTPDGRLIGQHQGLLHYTLGQRRGLGIGGISSASKDPWYVLDKDMKQNVLIVGQGHDHPLLYHNSLTADNVTWVAGKTPPHWIQCSAKIRYRQMDQGCVVETLTDHRCRVVFDHPQRAITPGQHVVFYHREECLGGGVILNAFDTDAHNEPTIQLAG